MKKEPPINDTATGYPSDEQIAVWKEKHGKVKRINVVDPKDGSSKYAIIRVPKMRDLSIATAAEKKQALGFNSSIWSNCKLYADPAIEADDALLAGAHAKLDEIIVIAEASVEEL